MNLSFDDPSLDSLDPSLSLNDPNDIDTALLNDIDGKMSCLSQFPALALLVHNLLWLITQIIKMHRVSGWIRQKYSGRQTRVGQTHIRLGESYTTAFVVILKICHFFHLLLSNYIINMPYGGIVLCISISLLSTGPSIVIQGSIIMLIHTCTHWVSVWQF